jgi:hypothetical protein
MSGSITVGGKILASHDNVSGKLSMSENVDMSNMVFPVGHVIGYNSTTTSDRTSISTGQTGVGTGLSVSLLPKYSNSKIIVQADICSGKDSNNVGVGYFIYRTTPSPTSDSGFNYVNSSFNASSWTYLNTASESVINELPIFFEDVPVNNTETHTYEVYVISNSSLTTYLNRRGSDTVWTGRSSIMIFEVSQ